MRTLISSLLLASASITSAYATTITQPSIVEMETSVGTITIQLDWDKAPFSAQNFLNYVNSSFYKNTFFHRVYSVADPKDSTKTFIKIIQGGGFDAPTMKQKTTSASIVNEASNGLHNSVGTIAMARAADPNSATSQFFFNLTDNSSSFDFSGSSNPGYAVFGSVISGLEVVNKIGSYNTISVPNNYGGSSASPTPVPYSEIYDCGFSFCMKKVIIDAVYTSDVVDSINSWTRVTVNGNGRVTSTPRSFTCSASSTSCTLKKPFGTAISLVAQPLTGYEFTGWSGDCSGATTSLILDTKTKNNNCTATFTQKVGL